MSDLIPISNHHLPARNLRSRRDRHPPHRRTIEFFTAHISNPNTRKAYGRATADFFAWTERAGLCDLGSIELVHVAAWIESLARGGLSAPTIKQRLAPSQRLPHDPPARPYRRH